MERDRAGPPGGGEEEGRQASPAAAEPACVRAGQAARGCAAAEHAHDRAFAAARADGRGRPWYTM
jgi:hypothetical protein